MKVFFSNMRGVLVSVCLVGLLCCVGARQAQAQRWLQTVEVVTPVEAAGPTGALLDTLTNVLRRQEQDLPLRREPDGPSTTFRELEEDLLSEGLDFSSANRLFINYRLEADERGYSEIIESLYFIYRPQQAGETDVPIFYLDMSNPQTREAVFDSGTRLHVNEAVFEPFRQQLTFPKLIQNGSSLVSVGSRILRDSTAALREKERLMETIQRFSYY